MSSEDDWFAGVSEEPVERDAPVWEDDFVAPPEQPAPPGLGSRQVAVVLAALVAVAIVGVLIVGIRALTGSGDGSVPATTIETTPPADTTPTTTPTETGGTTTTPGTTTSPSADPVPTGEVLRPGASGAPVTALQKALTALGLDPGGVDGSYGPSTQAAVTAFQRQKGLTADGIAGPMTIAAINEALAAG